MILSRAKYLYYLLGIMAPSIDAVLAGFYTVFLLHYLSLGEVGVLFAFHLLVLSLSDFPTGSLVDIWGPRRCLMVSYGLFLCAYLCLELVIFAQILILPLFFLIQFYYFHLKL